MSERHLGDVARKIGALGRPVAERRSEAVNGHASRRRGTWFVISVRRVSRERAHAPQQHGHRHARQRAPGLTPANTKSLMRLACSRLRTASAASTSGTRCSLTAFMRSGGTVQVLDGKVDLLPGRAQRLAAARRREDRELQRARRPVVPLAQRRHERADLRIGQGLMVLDAPHLRLLRQDVPQMALPPCRVFAAAGSRARAPSRAPIRCGRARVTRSLVS